jgi:hypothetical protein
MSKLNWATAGTKAKAIGCGLWILGASLIASCTPEAISSPEPTQLLIPATATFTPSPVPPTFTPSSELSAPGELVTPPAVTTPAADSDLLAEDQIAAELAALVQRRIAQEQGVSVNRVEIVSVEAFVWGDTSLGCPLAGQTYAPVQVDGYRIVLALGDDEFIFHTDADRAIPCAPELERLPES